MGSQNQEDLVLKGEKTEGGKVNHVSGRIELVPLNFQARGLFDSLDISENTRREYEYRIRAFFDFLRTGGLHKNSFLDFKRELAKRSDLSVSSKNKYLVTARILCRQLHRESVIPTDITQNVKSFQQSRKHKREGLNDGEVNAVVSYLHQLSPTSRNMRLKSILCLLVMQGLRQCEIIRLDVKHLDLPAQRCFIQGKGEVDLTPVDLHPQTCQILKQYLQISKIADGVLFVSHSNNSKYQRLTTKSIRNLINPIFRQLGIQKSVHGCRHYFTTKLIQSYKGDLLEVARYTRHRSLEMLQVYNDGIKAKSDLPRYYATFSEVNFTKNC